MPGKHFSLLARPPPAPSVHVAQVADWLVLHDAQVVHGAAEGDLDGLADAGGAAFHHFDLVDGFVHPEGNHFGSRKPLPEGVEQSQGQDVLPRMLNPQNKHLTIHLF